MTAPVAPVPSRSKTREKDNPLQIQGTYTTLIDHLRSMGSLVIAFSGGTDSTFLLKAAKDALGDRVAAYTVAAPYHIQWEIREAAELAERIGVRQILVQEDTIPPAIRQNPPDRCYLCKKALFAEMVRFAEREGFRHVADGTNADDRAEYRPGMQALQELGIRSPLLETGVTKRGIRVISREIGLTIWGKSASACLLSRIPYGQEVTEQDLRKIEQAEVYLLGLGFKTVRVRLHGNVARIEVSPEERERFFDTEMLDAVAEKMGDFDFAYATLDLPGYRTGSLDEGL